MPDPAASLKRFVLERLGARPALRVLEAGCGSGSWFDLPAMRGEGKIVGIDISAKQLERNTIIDEAIEGDLMAHRFAPDSFDLIISIDVLEHLDRPTAALDNLADALAPEGLLVLKIPNAASVKGLFTKFTPHGLHVWVYRKFRGRPNAGKDDVGPFKTFMRMSIAPRALQRWARQRGLEHAYEDYYEAAFQRRIRRKLGPLDPLARLGDRALEAVTGGRLSLARTEYIVVFRRAGV